MKIINFVLAAYLATTSVSVIAYGGRTDKQACHDDKKAGLGHCHYSLWPLARRFAWNLSNLIRGYRAT
jgi:hypothetical protein